MRRILILSIISTLTFAGARAGFAVGGNIGGHGDNTVKNGGIGMVGDPTGIPSHIQADHTGGVGPTNHVAPLSTITPPDNGILSSSSNATNTGGKGPTRTTGGNTNHVQNTMHGINSCTETPGGRGF